MNGKHNTKKNLKNYKIFLVDDDAFFMEMVSDFLSERKELSIRKFLNGKNCMDYLYLEPDIIFLDHNFGKLSAQEMTGLEILENIKKQSPETQVVMLTGQEDPSLVFQFIQKGARDYVIKDEEAFDNIQRIIMEVAEE